MRKLTTDILQDKHKYKALLAHRGDKAQQVLDCLQVVSRLNTLPTFPVILTPLPFRF